jgi:hypothetical protein
MHSMRRMRAALERQDRLSKLNNGGIRDACAANGSSVEHHCLLQHASSVDIAKKQCNLSRASLPVKTVVQCQATVR